MRKRYVFLGLAVIILGLGIYVLYGANKASYEAKAYADKAVPAIVADWSVDAIKQQVNPTMLRDPDTLRKVFAVYSNLGPLVAYHDGKVIGANVNVSPGNGKVVTAIYVAQARFKNGDASIQVVLNQIDGIWKISKLTVTSKKLFEGTKKDPPFQGRAEDPALAARGGVGDLELAPHFRCAGCPPWKIVGPVLFTKMLRLFCP